MVAERDRPPLRSVDAKFLSQRAAAEKHCGSRSRCATAGSETSADLPLVFDITAGEKPRQSLLQIA